MKSLNKINSFLDRIRPVWTAMLFSVILVTACEKDSESFNFAPKVTTGSVTNVFRNDATLSGRIEVPEGSVVKRYGVLLSTLQGIQ
jgi:uncharacterized lipoprotein YajG